MNAALLRSKRVLVLALTLLTVLTGLNAIQLLSAPAASAATSASAGEPKANINCDQGFSACQGSISTSGGSVPDTGGVITTPGSSVPQGNGFSFLLPCYYRAVNSTVPGSALGQTDKYPINAKNAGDASSFCAKTTTNQGPRTQQTAPPKGDTGARAVPGSCDAIMIDGQWTAAIGMINRSTAGWTKVAGSRPAQWKISFTFSCVYPSHKADYFANKWQRYCLMNNNEFRVYYTQNASVARASNAGWGSGEIVSTKTGVDPNPRYSQATAKTCAQGLENTWQTYRLPQADQTDGYAGPKYGFYRFSIRGTQILCSGQDPEAWTNNQKTSTCDPATRSTIYAHVNYTYTCRASGFDKTSPAQSDSQYFLPAGCINYTCNLNPTLIAQQQPSTPVSVLRNGEQTNTRIGNFTVTGRGLVAGSVNNKRVKLNVVADSSPDNPDVGSNSSDEWFRIMNQVTGTRMSFGVWQPMAQTGALKAGLIFYWASDPDSHWQMRQSYQFDAKYRVYRQDRVNSSPYLQDIAQPNEICSNTTVSSKVTALRSISKVSP